MIVKDPPSSMLRAVAEEAFRLVQCVGIDSAGKDLSGVGLDGVVGAGQTRNRIQQNHRIAFVLDHPLGFFDDHFGDLDVPFWRLVKGRTNDFGAFATALHVGDFFRPFINQQYE